MLTELASADWPSVEAAFLVLFCAGFLGLVEPVSLVLALVFLFFSGEAAAFFAVLGEAVLFLGEAEADLFLAVPERSAGT